MQPEPYKKCRSNNEIAFIYQIKAKSGLTVEVRGPNVQN